MAPPTHPHAPAAAHAGDAPAWHLDDPVEACVPVALEAAPRLCGHTMNSDISCSWYHGPWPLMRLLGINATLKTHAPLYADTLTPLARGGAYPRVLVSGTADYLMPAVVLAAYRAAGVEPDLTVIDHCRTPLFLSEWYAGRIGARLRTETANIVSYENSRPFDIICTHSFLSFFPPDVRRAAVARWFALLRPGGKVLLANVVRPASTDGPSPFPKAKGERLRQQVMEGAAAWSPPLPIDLAQVRQLLDAYVTSFTRYAVRSRAELLAPFEQAGFKIERLTFDSAESLGLDRAGGHIPETGSEQREYVWLVAVRPE